MYLVYVATLGDFNISNFFVSKCKLLKERHLRYLEELLFLKIHTFTSMPFCISLRVFAAVQMFSIFKNFRFFLRGGRERHFSKLSQSLNFSQIITNNYMVSSFLYYIASCELYCYIIFLHTWCIQGL